MLTSDIGVSLPLCSMMCIGVTSQEQIFLIVWGVWHLAPLLEGLSIGSYGRYTERTLTYGDSAVMFWSICIGPRSWDNQEVTNRWWNRKWRW